MKIPVKSKQQIQEAMLKVNRHATALLYRKETPTLSKELKALQDACGELAAVIKNLA